MSDNSLSERFPPHWLDDRLPALSTDAVASALVGFRMPLLPDKSMEWLALAVRRALAMTIPNDNDSPERQSNSVTRAELQRLAEMAQCTWLALAQIREPEDSRLWEDAWRSEVLIAKACKETNVSPAEYTRFKSAVNELDWLSGFLRRAASAISSQGGQWRASKQKDIRKTRGQHLAVIYEAAFGEKVSANNYPYDKRHAAPTSYMEFYERMIILAFGRQETANSSDFLKEACRLHRRSPTTFSIDIIPGL